eukprot:CAMPEP_0194341414 /NCGR_PEP_ID=MMETSP0171-20130528/89660_1 /TAXON_ID=218684 /ORGANISM="Corethron pennatum, Strain L29A3" /LENGTH=66 /DNA_ID=CAMNT_0039106761 /DNA_START=139 /DNA_END=339 /DNA_ORIENTATION=-
MSPPAVLSPAARVLQRRALQCSFSSVFHLRASGMPAAAATEAENVFVAVVGVPLGLMGAVGLWHLR